MVGRFGPEGPHLEIVRKEPKEKKRRTVGTNKNPIPFLRGHPPPVLKGIEAMRLSPSTREMRAKGILSMLKKPDRQGIIDRSGQEKVDAMFLKRNSGLSHIAQEEANLKQVQTSLRVREELDVKTTTDQAVPFPQTKSSFFAITNSLASELHSGLAEANAQAKSDYLQKMVGDRKQNGVQKTKDSRWCPTPDCKTAMFANANSPMFSCPKCSLQFCFNCHTSEWHRAWRCENSKILKKENKAHTSKKMHEGWDELWD